MAGNEDSQLSWALAKNILSESDKNRLACCFFHFDTNGKIDYKAAAPDFGAASANAMRVGVNTALAKLRKANGASTSATKASSAGLRHDIEKEDIGTRKRKRAVSARGGSEDGGQNPSRNAKERRSKQNSNLNWHASMIHGKGEDPADYDAAEDNHHRPHSTKIKSEPTDGMGAEEILGFSIVP